MTSAPFQPDDVAVVIPTRDRWAILEQTLAALATQTVDGFDVVVVVDGEDQDPPALDGARVVVKERGGPGAARNAGVAATDRPLVLFVGDDIIPSPALVASHVAAHCRWPDPRRAVLGRIEWHPHVGHTRLARWLTRSASQFDFDSIQVDEAGFGRFYSSNVSLKRSLFSEVGGFDEQFSFDYEDLDIGWRLDQVGMRLMYEPAALAHHLHRYDWAGLERRYRSRAGAERLMMAKHPWFEPFFANRIREAAAHPPVSRLWPFVVDRLPARPVRLRRAAERRASLWYHQRLAPSFLEAWEASEVRR